MYRRVGFYGNCLYVYFYNKSYLGDCYNHDGLNKYERLFTSLPITFVFFYYCNIIEYVYKIITEYLLYDPNLK